MLEGLEELLRYLFIVGFNIQYLVNHFLHNKSKQTAVFLRQFETAIFGNQKIRSSVITKVYCCSLSTNLLQQCQNFIKFRTKFSPLILGDEIYSQ